MKNNKPFKDYICPRCRHNVGYKQEYCSLCGLELDWSEIEYPPVTYPVYPINPIIPYPTWREEPYFITTTTIITI